MMSDQTPDPVPVAPEDEPAPIFPSATGVVVPDDEDQQPTAPDATPD